MAQVTLKFLVTPIGQTATITLLPPSGNPIQATTDATGVATFASIDSTLSYQYAVYTPLDSAYSSTDFNPLDVITGDYETRKVELQRKDIGPQTVAEAESRVQSANQTILASGLASSVSIDDPEYIYPLDVSGKYLTSAQARIYIGSTFIDEIFDFQAALQLNRIPHWGYSDRDFSSLSTGRALVQGNFTINFVSEGYLYTILQDYAKTFLTRSAEDPQLEAQKTKLMGLLQAQQSNPSLQSDVDKLLSSLSQADVADVASRMRKQAPSFKTQADSSYVNPVYMQTPFTIEWTTQGAGRTTIQRIDRVFLTGNQRVLDQSGNPLMEAYQFIARRMR